LKNFLESVQESILYFRWFEQNWLDKLNLNVIEIDKKKYGELDPQSCCKIPPLEETKFLNIENKEVTIQLPLLKCLEKNEK